MIISQMHFFKHSRYICFNFVCVKINVPLNIHVIRINLFFNGFICTFIDGLAVECSLMKEVKEAIGRTQSDANNDNECKSFGL